MRLKPKVFMSLVCTATVVCVSVNVWTQQPTKVGKSDGSLGSTMKLDEIGTKVGKGASSRVSEKKTLDWTVQPAGESSPALKYRFWQSEFNLRPGSAQLHFSRALLMLNTFPKEFRREIEVWHSREEQPTESELQAHIDSLENVYSELRWFAVCEDSGLDHRLRDLRGSDMYMVLLPEIQQSRMLARLLALKARYQVSKGDFDGAAASLSDGFRLAKFVGSGETLVQSLVGTAIAGIMLNEVETAIQSPECPNMYWPLATLPRPINGIRRSIEFELNGIHRILPFLGEAETEDYPDGYWQQAWVQMLNDFEALGDGDVDSKVAFAIVVAAASEPAKQRLIDAGWDPKELSEMPNLRLILLDASLEIRRMADELAKVSLLPHALGVDVAAKAERELVEWIRERRMSSAGAAIVGLLFPAVSSARTAETRLEFRANRLMTVEALRLHAATHGGSLPATLEELSPVPALPNPFNGQPFQYRVEQHKHERVVILRADLRGALEHLRELRIRFPSSN